MTNDIDFMKRFLGRLDHLSLTDLADYFEAQADICRQEALNAVRSDSETLSMGISHLLKAPRITMRFLRQGHSLKEAHEKTATSMNVPIETIEGSWKRFLHDKSATELKRRNVFIIELAALGLSNIDIGKKVSLHAHTVRNIVKKFGKESNSRSTIRARQSKQLSNSKSNSRAYKKTINKENHASS